MKNSLYGPSLPISEEIHRDRHRGEGETFREAMSRIADTLCDGPEHFIEFRDILLEQRFMPGGRVQNSIGSPLETTAYNCFVSNTIPDSMKGIMETAADAAETMRRGGGIGYDFSTIRPRGALITSLNSKSTGPVPFMNIFNAVCGTISSAGHRRGAQMGVLRIDHPDVEDFIHAKTDGGSLTNFNISIGVTDDFMQAVKDRTLFPLRFDGVVYKMVNAESLWNKIMRATWDWAEPGILYIDTINNKNNLWYCETIAATNPCGEQPLPPHGACLLGSQNMTKYMVWSGSTWTLDWNAFKADVACIVRAMDNVIDRTTYPLAEQEAEAKNKRRMGLGLLGVANAIEAMGFSYGTQGYLSVQERIQIIQRNAAYEASALLAKEKGAFPMYTSEYLDGQFISTLPLYIRELIRKHGIRNSHLLSIAPTGTLALTADNTTGGIEPPFMLSYDRTIQTFDGPKVETVDDYGKRVFGVSGAVAGDLTPQQHVDVLNLASKYVDSAVSKTCNIGDTTTFDEFKDVYMQAYDGGASGCTTFRAAGKRFGIFNATDEDIAEEHDEGAACYVDPATGKKTCE